MKSNQITKNQIISIGNNINRFTIYDDEDIFILETILMQFVPFFREINDSLNFNNAEINKNTKLIQEIIVFINNVNNPLNNKNKKKKLFSVDNNIKYEEKEFLYKTYISSSDNNDGNFKFFNLDTLKINNITNQMVRGLLILIKEELNNSGFNHPCNILLEKLKKVKKLIINESKAFDFKILFILLNYIILKYCVNLEEVNFDGIFYSRIDQVDIMIKNGVYLNFIHRSSKISKLIVTNKLEFINENIAFKILHEFCYKNNIQDLDTEKVEFDKINIFSILTHKSNITSLILKKISIDKNSFINSIIEIIQNNKNLRVLYIDKFISIPDHFKMEMLSAIKNLSKLEKLKINMVSSNKLDLKFLQIPRSNLKLKKFNIKLSRVSIDQNESESGLIESYFNFKNTNLQKLYFQFEKFSLGAKEVNPCGISLNLNLINLLPLNIRELSIGMIDHVFLEKFTSLSPEYLLKLNTLKFSFLPIDEENYENLYKKIIYLLENCKLIRHFQFDNFFLKYKHICDDEIKNILKENSNLRKLVIRSDLPFYVKYIDGLYYYDFPKFLINILLFSIKKNKILSKLYYKKSILNNLISFHRIKKEKVVVISYKI